MTSQLWFVLGAEILYTTAESSITNLTSLLASVAPYRTSLDQCTCFPFSIDDKTFDDIEDLINDTLINLYLQASKNVDYHLTLGRTKQMNQKIRRSVKKRQEGPRQRAATRRVSRTQIHTKLERRISLSEESLYRPPLAVKTKKGASNRASALFGLVQATLATGVKSQYTYEEVKQ